MQDLVGGPQIRRNRRRAATPSPRGVRVREHHCSHRGQYACARIAFERPWAPSTAERYARARRLPMAYDVAADPRLDPRLKAILSAVPPFTARDVDSRETLLAEANSDAARQEAERFRSFMELCDTEEAAPSAGLRVRTEHVVSAPDDNTINLQVIRPDTDETLACVYYIHGGGMTSLSCYDGMYRGWGKLIAANGVAVVMVDFRNCVSPSSVPEVAPFPAGLNDCVSGLKWVVANAARLGIDPARVIVAGESGGGNLLRDEGINFYRLLLKAGIPARARQVMGTMHGTEIFTIACPEISRDTARDLAAFCTG